MEYGSSLREERCVFIHHFRGYSPFDGVDFVVGGVASWPELAVNVTHTPEDEEAGLRTVSGPGFRSHSYIPSYPARPHLPLVASSQNSTY